MQVTVVGGGFGGVKAALELSKNKKNIITLISDKPDFQYYPALYSTATGRSGKQSWIPLSEIFAHNDNVEVIIDTVVGIDRRAQTITTASNAVHRYKKLVLALGTVTTYFGIEGLDHYAYGIKSHDEIVRLQHHLLREFKEPHGADSHFLIIGAGPTGVELAAALGAYLQHLKKKFRQPEPRMSISIIEAAPRVLPRMSEKASAKVEARLRSLGVHVELGKKVEAETADTLMVSGRPIKSHTVIWTSGVATNPFYAANAAQFELAPNGRVTVNQHMQVDPHVYVIGDNANTSYCGLAQTALYDGRYVASYVSGHTKKPYIPKQPPVVVPVGDNWAIFEYKSIRFSGFIGSLVRSAADLTGYSELLPLTKALQIWLSQSASVADLYDTRITDEKS